MDLPPKCLDSVIDLFSSGEGWFFVFTFPVV